MIRSSFREAQRAFTLVEMLTVMAVIAVLTGMILAVNGYVQNKAARERATGEIAEMMQASESYRTDFGEFPNDNRTEELDPKVDYNPVTGDTHDKYRKASRLLYSALAGDFEPEDEPDGKPEKK